MHQSMAQVARADQHDGPLILNVQDVPELPDQVLNIVACALLTKLTKMRQVLANLGRADAQLLRQLLGRSDCVPLRRHSVQATQIQWQTTYHNVRRVLCGLNHVCLPNHD